MGSKTARGQAKWAPMSVQIERVRQAKLKEEQAKLAEEQKVAGGERYERQKAWKKARGERKDPQHKKTQQQKAIDYKSTEENAKNIATTINFECIQPHYAMIIRQAADVKQLVLTINFCADPPTDIHAIVAILPEYATCITNVHIKLLSPSLHGSRANYKHRVNNMKKLIDALNQFPITKLSLLADIDDHSNFQQLKLAAVLNGLIFQDWVMAYQVMGEGAYKIEKYHSYGKRLSGVYRAEFSSQ